MKFRWWIGVAVVVAQVSLAPPRANPSFEFHASDAHLERLIRILLEENPQIESARAVSRSRLERVAQQRSLPDPMVAYRYFAREPETRVGPQQQALELSQRVPWFGKRGLAAERAEHVATGADWSARDLERALVAELKRAYYDASYYQEALLTNAEETAILQRFESIALTRYSTGKGRQHSVVKVQTDISRLADRATSLRERLTVLERRIARLIGRPEEAVPLAPIRLALIEVSPDIGGLVDESLDGHPLVRAIEQQVEADRVWSRRQELEKRPNFVLGMGYVDVGSREDAAGVLNPPSDNGQDILSVMVGVNVPIYRQRVRAGVAEARESLRANEYRLRSTRDQLRYAVQESLVRIESVGQRVKLYDEVIVPQADESLASVEAGYTTGRQDFLDLLDAERVLFEVRLTAHRLLADYWIALTDLELGLGRSFPGGSQ